MFCVFLDFHRSVLVRNSATLSLIAVNSIFLVHYCPGRLPGKFTIGQPRFQANMPLIRWYIARRYWSQTETAKQFALIIDVAVKPGKPWTPEIFLEYNCVARKKPIRREKTKPRATTLTSLCFYGRSRVLIFAVIGREKINMPEIFQVLRFRRVHCN